MSASGRWRELADGVYARRYQELDLTVGLVVGDGGCLVIDTRGDAVQGAELAAAVRGVTAAPWQVVLTHAHFDHCFGTGAFLDPGPTPVWAHRRCRSVLRDTAEAQRRRWMAWYAGSQPAVAQALAGTPVPLPDRTFDDRVSLAVGGREVVLAHPGPGHTDHDVVVWVPDSAVVFAGDLVEHGAPPAFDDAHPLHWPAAVDAVLALAPTVVVPGHGEPVGPDFVRAQHAELAAVAELCRRAAQGEDLDVADSPYPPEVTRTALARVTSAAG